MWFFARKSHRWQDVKMQVKFAFRKPMAGVGGVAGLTKALTPSHYDETIENPRKTLCLLRAWSLWRAAKGGWGHSHPGRKRRLEAMEASVAAEVRAVDGRAVLKRPLFQNQKAHKFFFQWAPELVQGLLS